MARLVYGMNVSLDGYVDHQKFAPDPVLFRHFIDQVRGSAGCVYGRRLYGIMRYWEEDDPDWTPDLKAFAAAWRAERKWVASRSLTSVGPGAVLVADGVEAVVRRLKQELEGELYVGGPVLAQALTGLIDEYRLYLHPVVLGGGDPFFAGPRPPLRLVSCRRIGAEALELAYAPA